MLKSWRILSLSLFVFLFLFIFCRYPSMHAFMGTYRDRHAKMDRWTDGQMDTRVRALRLASSYLPFPSTFFGTPCELESER